MKEVMAVDMTVGSLLTEVPMSISGDNSISLSADTVIFRHITDYDGEYEVTPSSQVQVLNTAMTRVKQNITINPIPSNYGLVTWDGSHLTIS